MTTPAHGVRDSSITDALPALAQMAGMMGGFRLSRAVYVVAALGVADMLREGPLSCDEMAERCTVHAPSLYRVMRALASAGFFWEDELGQFSLTPPGSSLRSDAADTVLPAAVELGEERQWRLWGHLSYSVQSGEAAWNRLFGTEFVDACIADEQLGRSVNAARAAIYKPSDAAILEAYDFSPYARVVAVGLASGCEGLLSRILQMHGSSTGVLYDLPHIVAGAADGIGAIGLADRCRLVGGDCREAVPVWGDACVLRGLVHNLSDEMACSVLRHCRTAVEEGGKVLLCEMIMPPGNEFFVGKLVDLEDLLLTTDAHERTEEDFRRLIEAAGYRIAGVTSTAAPISVIELEIL